MAARGEGGWTTRRADATQVTKFLCESFPDASQEQVFKVWEEQRGNVTRCVEVLSELSEAMRRQITVIKVGYPFKFALEAHTRTVTRTRTQAHIRNKCDCLPPFFDPCPNTLFPPSNPPTQSLAVLHAPSCLDPKFNLRISHIQPPIQAPIPADLGQESCLDESGEKECLVCFNSALPIDVVLLPCQHSGMCVDCALLVLRKNPPECPICRAAVEEIIRFVGEEEGEGQGEGGVAAGRGDHARENAADGDRGAGVQPNSQGYEGVGVHGDQDSIVIDSRPEPATLCVPQESDRWPFLFTLASLTHSELPQLPQILTPEPSALTLFLHTMFEPRS